MNSPMSGRLTLEAAAEYEICVQGYLRPDHSDYVQGMKIETVSDGDAYPMSILRGKLVDQAALAGVLTSLYDWGLPLLSVQCLRGGPAQ